MTFMVEALLFDLLDAPILRDKDGRFNSDNFSIRMSKTAQISK
jgi:hypothetical protein